MGQKDKKNAMRRAVVQIDPHTGEKIARFDSVQAAADAVGLPRSSVSRVCGGKYISAGGYAWRYEEDADAYMAGTDSLGNKRPATDTSRAVIQIDRQTGEEIARFDSISLAARAVGLRSSSIVSACKGKHDSSGGFIWRYADENPLAIIDDRDTDDSRMYHKEQKVAYLDSTKSKSTRDINHWMFRALAPYETELDKDVSEMDAEELRPVFDDIAYSSKMQTICQRLSCLKKYVEWYEQNGFGAASDAWHEMNAYGGVTAAAKQIRASGLQKMRSQYVASPTHLQSLLDAVFQPPEQGTLDVVCRCYLWLGFMGFPEKNIAKLTGDNLLLDQFKLVFEDRSYPLYAESLPAFRAAATMTAFFINRNGTLSDIAYQRFPGNGLLRGIGTDYYPAETKSRIDRKNRAAAKNSGKRIEQFIYKRMIASGIFYRVYTRERAGLPVEPKQEFFFEACDRGIAQRSAMRTADAWNVDYEFWKQAFSV